MDFENEGGGAGIQAKIISWLLGLLTLEFFLEFFLCRSLRRLRIAVVIRLAAVPAVASIVLLIVWTHLVKLNRTVFEVERMTAEKAGCRLDVAGMNCCAEVLGKGVGRAHKKIATYSRARSSGGEFCQQR